MRFVDLLRTCVLLCAAAATVLALCCLAGAAGDAESSVVLFCAGWWVVAGIVGTQLGRRAAAGAAIERALADARAATMMPDHRPGAVTLNRLWPLLLATVASGACAVFAPQIPGIAAGFAAIWALSWRRQDAAVTAIEERDGVTFYVERTSPVEAIKLVRTPGFRREVPTMPAAG